MNTTVDWKLIQSSKRKELERKRMYIRAEPYIVLVCFLISIYTLSFGCTWVWKAHRSRGFDTAKIRWWRKKEREEVKKSKNRKEKTKRKGAMGLRWGCGTKKTWEAYAAHKSLSLSLSPPLISSRVEGNCYEQHVLGSAMSRSNTHAAKLTSKGNGKAATTLEPCSKRCT